MGGSIKTALSPSSVIRFDSLCLPEPKINASDQTIIPADTSSKVILQCNLTTAHTPHKESFWMKNGQEIPKTRTEERNTAYRWQTASPLYVVRKTNVGRGQFGYKVPPAMESDAEKMSESWTCWGSTLIVSKFEMGVLLTFSEIVTRVCLFVSAWLTNSCYLLLTVAYIFCSKITSPSFVHFPDKGETTTH